MSRSSTQANPSLESLLRQAADSTVPGVRQAAQHLIEAGGKRVRPRFTTMLGRLLGSTGDTAQVIGAAAELVHTATLLHDDVIDQSEWRRGRPSTHMKYGAVNAILAGDFLLAMSLQTLTSRGLFKATHELTLAMRELVEAELLQAEKAYCMDTTLQETRRIAEGKTGALFAWCARALAVSLDLPQERVQTADELGRLVGYAFQIADDLMDLAGHDTGKPVHKDLLEGQLTIPVQLVRAVDSRVEADVRAAFTRRRDEDFVTAYRAVERSRARQLGQAELALCREQLQELWSRMDSAPESGASLLSFFDDCIGVR